MEQIILFLEKNVSYPLFIIIILSGIFITKYTKDLNIKDAYKVLIASIVFSTIFYFIDDCKNECLQKYLITYLLATSFYELFLKIIKEKIGKDELVK